jgi:rSAM/selenodomain-associated transferase 1
MACEPRVLGIFAKQPVPGAAKTRLAERTSPDWAARVARAFLDDTLARCGGIQARRVLAFAPTEARPFFETCAAGRFAVEPQSSGDLGARLQSFFERQSRSGATRTVVVGTDSPTVPVDYIEQAFAQLADHEVVLGPADDGGYYLVGCAARVPPIFAGIDWGTDRVLAQTVARLDGWRYTLLPSWYDVDTLDDWYRLSAHLTSLRRAGQDPKSPHVEALLREDAAPPFGGI